MSPKEWKQLKEQLIARGFEVKVSGKSKKEYIASADFVVDILRGGVTHSGSTLEVFFFDSSMDNMVDHYNCRSITKILNDIDSRINDFKEFGSIA